ncbi:hemin uptake protein HemP [Allorhodopirellula heiligendammensis]|uniref:hemin uptake protein HemP n=1 Tax=Allorhodopirellula heiligendammensis TaxID=2714739 RepID=UPI0026602878|nr:hemin uptake protein HemP [Allorhodopirellula heiligendammensis]
MPPSIESSCQHFRVLASDDLLHGNKEVWIKHGDVMYRLRKTGSGKLYLTK